MAKKTFFDTNILVYSVDSDSPEKQQIALHHIKKHALAKTGVLSTQVLQEFYSAATKKLHIEPLVAKNHVKGFQIFDIVQVTPQIIEDGIDVSILNQLSFWDGIVVAAAKLARCVDLLSEDLSDGQTFGGVTVVNPF